MRMNVVTSYANLEANYVVKFEKDEKWLKSIDL